MMPTCLRWARASCGRKRRCASWTPGWPHRSPAAAMSAGSRRSRQSKKKSGQRNKGRGRPRAELTASGQSRISKREARRRFGAKRQKEELMYHAWTEGDFEISTDPARIDLGVVHDFLTNSYWARGIPLETVQRSIENSICFGIYHGVRQVGFARVVTDHATFAY